MQRVTIELNNGADVVKFLLYTKNKSRNELASDLGICPATLGHIERRTRRMKVSTAIKVKELFGLDLEVSLK